MPTPVARRSRRGPRRGRRQAGFSILEVLIAAALLGLIAVGVLPLFTQSMLNNVAGNDATRSSTFATDQLEEMMQVRFHADEVSWDTATMTDATPWAMLLPGHTTWEGYDAAAHPQFRRRLVVGQLQIGLDGTLQEVPGNAPRGDVHLKRVVAEIGTSRLPADPAADPTVYRARLVKGY